VEGGQQGGLVAAQSYAQAAGLGHRLHDAGQTEFPCRGHRFALGQGDAPAGHRHARLGAQLTGAALVAGVQGGLRVEAGQAQGTGRGGRDGHAVVRRGVHAPQVDARLEAAQLCDDPVGGGGVGEHGRAGAAHRVEDGGGVGVQLHVPGEEDRLEAQLPGGVEGHRAEAVQPGLHDREHLGLALALTVHGVAHLSSDLVHPG
jgi:hypothetical protein